VAYFIFSKTKRLLYWLIKSKPMPKYKYTLVDGKDSITIISNSQGRMDRKYALTIKFLSIQLYNGVLGYWTGRFIKTGMVEVNLEPGKPYEHIFEGVVITSKDQKTFHIKI
jgi:hypothetical protein